MREHRSYGTQVKSFRPPDSERLMNRSENDVDKPADFDMRTEHDNVQRRFSDYRRKFRVLY